MNIFLTKKSFLIPLLIFTLCADTDLTAYAGEAAVQSDPSSGESATTNPSTDTSNGSSDEGNSSEDGSGGDVPAGNTPVDKPASDTSSDEDPSASDSPAADSPVSDSPTGDSSTEEASSDSIPTEETDILPADETEDELIPAAAPGESSILREPSPQAKNAPGRPLPSKARRNTRPF